MTGRMGSGIMDAGVLMDFVDGRCLNCLTVVVYICYREETSPNGGKILIFIQKCHPGQINHYHIH